MMRRLSPAFALLVGLLLVAACTKTNSLNARQSGVWRIRQVTVTTSDPATALTSTRAATDLGDVAFTDLAGDENRAVVHADSVLPSRCLARISEDPTRRALPIGDYAYRWQNDPYSTEQLVFFRDQGGLGLTAATTFTVTESKRDSQRWLYVEVNSADQVLLREEWELERVK